MKGITTYVYGLRRKEKVVYVGKSIAPKARFIAHNPPNSNKYDDMIILEVFEDKENFWVQKLLSEGCLLENKETLKYCEDWKVGDIIVLLGIKIGNKKNHRKTPVRYIPTQQTFPSMKEAAAMFGVTPTTVRNNIHCLKPNKVKWEYV